MGFCKTFNLRINGVLFFCLACLSAVTDRKLFIQSGGISNGAAFFNYDEKNYMNSIDISQGE